MTVSCEKVGLDYFSSAPTRYTASEVIAATPERVFEVFLDAGSWTKWVFAITAVEWTSGFPIEVGSTRSVYMRGGIVGHEEFIAWEPGTRMAFRFNEASRDAIAAFAEDYQVTDLGNGTCRVDWVMAMTLSTPPRLPAVMDRIMTAFIRRTLRNLRRYIESNPTLEEPS